jgi:hypothetical protein
MNRRFVIASFTFLLLLGSGVMAQDTPPAAPAVNDYGAGFAMLRNFGLPDSSGATYVKFDFTTGHPAMYNDPSMRFMHMLRTKGNGWLVQSSSTNEPHRYIAGVTVVDVYDRAVIQQEQRAQRRKALEQAREENANKSVTIMYDSTQQKASGRWQEVDPAEDVKTILKTLDEYSAETHMRYQLNQIAGKLFIDAAHLYQNGYTNEANQIAEKLFSAVDDRQQVVLGGLNLIADTYYSQATRQFSEEHDWMAYHDELLDLLKKFSRGWQKAPAVKRLLVAIQNRLKNPEPPPVQGEELTEEDMAIAVALCDLSPDDLRMHHAYGQRGFRAGSLWVLRAPETNGVSESASDTPNAYYQILNRGKASIPLLLGLLDDTYLLPLDRTAIPYASRYSSYSSSSAMTEEQITQIYNNMDRPISRGELAMSLLKMVIPVSDEDGYRQATMGAEEFIPIAKEWYASNKDKSSSALARVYLEQGNSQQRNDAVGYLSRYGEKDDIAVVENMFLDADWQQYGYMATEYIKKRGEEAAAFAEKYTNMLVSVIEKGDWDADSAQDMLRRIQMVTNVQSIDEILAELQSGKKTFTEVRSVLHSRMYEESDKDKLVHAFLKTASEIEDATVAASLVGLISGLSHFAYYSEADGGWKFDAKQQEELWKKLLSDERLAPLSFATEPYTVAYYAANTLMFLQPKVNREAVSNLSRLGQRGRSWVIKRAKALLSGGGAATLDPVPSELDVSPEKIEEVLASIQSSSDVRSLMNELPIDVLLALSTPFAEQSNLWAQVAPIAHTVEKVTIDPAVDSHFGWLRSLESKPFDAGIVDRVVDACMTLAKSGETVSVTALRAPLFGGITIHAELVSSNSPLASILSLSSHYRNTRKVARVRAHIQAPRLYSQADWYQEEETAPPSDAHSESTGDDLLMDEFEFEMSVAESGRKEEAQEKFRKDLAAWLLPSCDVYPSAALSIIGSPASQTDAESNELPGGFLSF